MLRMMLVFVAVGIVGFLVITALMHFQSLADRLDDDDHQIKRKTARDYRDAQADLEHEIEIAERRSRREYQEESK